MLLANQVVASTWFNHLITSVIVINAIVIGLDTSDSLHSQYSHIFELANYLFLIIFIVVFTSR